MPSPLRAYVAALALRLSQDWHGAADELVDTAKAIDP